MPRRRAAPRARADASNAPRARPRCRRSARMRVRDDECRGSRCAAPGTYCKARYESSAARSGSRCTPGTASSDFTSDANANVPSSRRVQTRGFFPSRSRASRRRCSAASQRAIANIPSRRSTKAGPYSSYRWGMTGVSPRPRTSCPRAARSRRSSGKLYSSPLKTATTSPRSFATGWYPSSGSSTWSRWWPSTHAPNASVEP